MKSFIPVSILALTASAAAAPASKLGFSKRQSTCIVDTATDPSSSDIISAIDQWFSDVSAVNTYLNTVSSIIDDSASLLTATQNVLVFAQDEPCQFQTLLNNPDNAAGALSDDFTCASDDLKNVFQPHVLDNLNTIISDPTDLTSVHAAVDDINTFRCCNVLPDVDLLWLDSATDFGVANQVAITAPREDACASIDCSTVATAANCKNTSK